MCLCYEPDTKNHSLPCILWWTVVGEVKGGRWQVHLVEQQIKAEHFLTLVKIKYWFLILMWLKFKAVHLYDKSTHSNNKPFRGILRKSNLPKYCPAALRVSSHFAHLARRALLSFFFLNLRASKRPKQIKQSVSAVSKW